MKMKNLIREKIEKNGYALGAFIASGSDTNCEILGLNGMDFLIVDCEHAQTDPESLVRMFRSCELYNMAPLVRVYDPDDAPMMSRMLDIGAHGCMAPLVNTKVQAEKITRYMKYPPIGMRGANGGRGPKWGAYDNYSQTCNANTLAIVQCESLEGVRNIEDIASTDGIDAVFIGTGDLSLEMGIQFKADSAANHQVDSSEMVEIIDRILSVCKKNNKIPGIVTASPDDAVRRIKQGFQLVTCMNDLGFFKSQSSKHINTIRESAK